MTDFDHGGDDQVAGKVKRADGKAVDRGVVLVHFKRAGKEDHDAYVEAKLDGEGRFAARAPHGWTAATAYYLPADGLADSTSPTLVGRGHGTPGTPEQQQRPKA